jgi:nucleoside-diphosphate-sugar epimerase
VTTPAARLKVAITGATGFVGTNLLARTPPNWDVVAIVRGDRSPPGVATAPFPADDAPVAPSTDWEFDVVVHLAGNSNHGLAETEPWHDLDATARTAAVTFGRIPARRIVVLSSAAVYAGRVGLVSPTTPLRPRMAYALSKLYVEGLVDARLAAGAIESALVIRLYNAFGPGERQTRLIPRVATSSGSFTLTGDPTSLSDPVHVDDLVGALVAAAESKTSGTFDYCGGDPVPLKEQIARIGHALGRPAMRLEVEPRQGETPIKFYSDVAPICEALGLPRPEPFEDAVRRYGRASGWTA